MATTTETPELHPEETPETFTPDDTPAFGEVPYFTPEGSSEEGSDSDSDSEIDDVIDLENVAKVCICFHIESEAKLTLLNFNR